MEKSDHEGKRLAQLLRSKGRKNPAAALAKAGDVTWAGAKKWIASESIGLSMRESIVEALKVLGIDPREMWYQEAGDTYEALKKVVREIPIEHLERVRRLLMASRGDIIRLVDYIEGRIEESK